MMWPFTKAKPEERVTQATADFASLVGKGLITNLPTSSVPVNDRTALEVPAVWAAVNFLSGTIASLPLHVYERDGEGRKRFQGPISGVLHDAVNDDTTSFEWRKYSYERFLTGGRAFTLILRNGRREPTALQPLNPENVTIKRNNNIKRYHYEEAGEHRAYEASDIIDLPFMLKPDRLSHVGPLVAGKEAIGLALAVQMYASKFFANGGVPPFAVSGNFQSGDALSRAADDLADAVRKASAEGRQALTLPAGLDIQAIGTDPEKNQLLETQRFCVEQIARIYSLPPNFLQDLSRATFSNVEQQDLHLVKHTLRRLIEQFEAELNLKLWGAKNRKYFVEFNLDGLLRGDFATRMGGYATAIQNAVMMPNEARRKENLPEAPDGNTLLIQGATVPLGTEPQPDPEPPANEQSEKENQDEV